ncbi:hypothetical protein [Brevundimonas lenta]|uniref:Chemotaxis protein n=1 Tax=Brevundimonas lenta TaxID=424796 RepID=A0A7W6JBA3_9CAUL|nr:hypothetical protein [Brevundimonas lenta]MBB4081907.1 hypothetical protein [Brevundimonas lenta]
MNTNLWAAALGAAMVLGWTPAAAAPPPGSGAPALEQPGANEDELARQWLADSARWSTAYSEILSARTDRIGRFSDATAQFIDRVDAGDRAGARAWAEAWIAAERSGMAGERATFDTLPTDPPALPGFLVEYPEARAVRLGYIEFRDGLATFLRQTDAAFADYSNLMITATSGRDQDRLALINGVMMLSAAAIDSEIILLRTMRSKPGEPQHHLVSAMLESDYAMSAWMKQFAATLLGKEVDRDLVATEMRQRAAAASQQADDLAAAARQSRTEMNAAMQQAGMAQVFGAAMDSYIESANVEREIAALLTKLADKTAAGDLEGQLALSQAMEGLGTRRMTLQQDRAAMVAAVSD